MFKYCEVVRDIAQTGPPFAWLQYDEQFRSFRQSNPTNVPWDQHRWDLFFRCMYTRQVQVGMYHAPAIIPNKPTRHSQPMPLQACVLKVRSPPSVLVVNVTLPTPINPDALQQALIGYDQTEAADGFRTGFRINYHDTRTLRLSDNHPSISHHKDILERNLSKELQMGRVAGPFVSPPFHD